MSLDNGHPTLIQEYSDGGSTLYRKLERWYTVNTNAWVTDRLSREVLWDASSVCQGETRYLYDDHGNYTDAPVDGDLTRVQVAQTSCGGTWSETYFTNDAWGNRTSVMDARGNTTTTTYDTSGAYPKYVYPLTITEQAIGSTQFTTTYT